MTHLYISADLEGACGITSPLQCFPHKDRTAYDKAVLQLAKEVNAVIEAALEAGAQQIAVNDSHGYMTNLRPDHLPANVALLSGKPKVCAMSAGLDSHFDAAIYIGYHAKAGTERGVLCHTFHDKVFDISINSISYGEGGINALYASLIHGVPIILASGDDTFCTEIHQLIPSLETIQTKTAITFAAALSRPEADILAEYRQKTTRLLHHKDTWHKNLLTLPPPYTLHMTLINTLAADTAMMMPGWLRIDGRTIAYHADNFQDIYQALQSAYAILSYSAYME